MTERDAGPSEGPHPSAPDVQDRAGGAAPAGGACCCTCGAALCDRQRVISRILGGRRESRCLECLALEMGASAEQLCDLVGRYLVQRECYREAWVRANVCAEEGRMACCPSRLECAERPPGWYQAELFRPQPGELPSEPDLCLDAEESGCGDLMVLLLRSMRKVPPGGILKLVARDPGAEADIPSWCRMTGNPLLAGPVGPELDTYYLQRKPAAG